MKPITRFVIKLGIPMAMLVAGATYIGKAYPCSPGGEVQEQKYFGDGGYLGENQAISGMPNRYLTGAIVNVNLEFPEMIESFPNEVSLFTELNHDGQREKISLYKLPEDRGKIIGSLLYDKKNDGDLDLAIIELDKRGRQRVRCLENLTKGKIK